MKWLKKEELKKKVIKFVQQALHGLKELLTRILQRMLTWLQASIAKTLTMLKVQNNKTNK